MDIAYKTRGANRQVGQTIAVKTVVVGIGASAGGLKAFISLLQHLPTDTGLSFVLIQHLDPAHPSASTEILSRATSMPTVEVKGTTRAEPNSIYIIPPDADLQLFHGILHVSKRTDPSGRHFPIDRFFRSLAADEDAGAIGVVLSGNGADGSLGLRAIKESGGIMFAQDPETAKYDGMPRAALDTGLIDFCLPVEQIAKELARLGKHPYVSPSRRPKQETAIPGVGDDLLSKIYIKLRASTEVDFSDHKRSTVLRRLERRMAVRALDKIDEYSEYLATHPSEIEALYQDLLIPVTSFFRDPDAFEALKQNVFPNLIKNRDPAAPIRLWVPGCSSGEEAYTLAMTLLEFLEAEGFRSPVQIFASDVNQRMIDRARTGDYPESIACDVSPERLRRFFTKSTGYRVIKRVRETCIFAKHDLTRDPPFPNLDLISCRNLLIYFDAALQYRVIPVFHYALRPGGYLMLGSSEGIGRATDLFAAQDKKNRIYLKKPVASRLPLRYAPAPSISGLSAPVEAQKGGNGKENVRQIADRLVLSKYSPAGVVVDDNMQIIQFRGRTGSYLEPADGLATFDLFLMAKEGLNPALRTTIDEARAKMAPATTRGVPFKLDNAFSKVDVTVTPFRTAAEERYFLILFSEMRPADHKKTKTGAPASAPGSIAEGAEIAELKAELEAARAGLQALAEEKEVSTEELRAANEEVQSSNEELQSINEELETSKEELQSSNEELNTVNEELQIRNAELSQVNDDLANLLSSSDIPFILLGRDLAIRRYNVPSERFLSLIPGDIGRPIADIRPKFELPELDALARSVIDSVRTIDKDFQDPEGRWYSLRINPFISSDNKIDGAVVSIIDIDAAKRVAEHASRLAAVMHDSNDSIIIFDLEGRILEWNRGAASIYGYSEQEALAMNVSSVIPTEERENFRKFLADAHAGPPIKSYETRRVSRDGRIIDIWLTLTLIAGTDGKPVAFASTGRDITGRKRTEARLAQELDIDARLAGISGIMTSIRSFDNMMQRVIAEATDAMGTEAGGIALLERGEWVVRFGSRLSGDTIGLRVSEDWAEELSRVVKSGNVLVSSHTESDPRAPGELTDRFKVRSLVAAPLPGRESILGVMFFVNRSEPFDPTDVQINFAKRLGFQLGLAAENTRLSEAEHRIAQELQTPLLKLLPGDFAGIEFGHRYHSAAEAATVGGDFYDVFEIDENRVGVALGDVSGKGLGAATLASLVKAVIRAWAYHEESPSTIIKKVNKVVIRTAPSLMFVTLFYGVIDLTTRTVTYCCAGHPPTLVKRSGSRVEALGERCGLVGVFDEYDCEDAHDQLQPGDFMILYSDGLTEAKGKADRFGEERLAELVATSRPESAEGLVDAIFESVGRFTGGHLTDDVACVVIKLLN